MFFSETRSLIYGEHQQANIGRDTRYGHKGIIGYGIITSFILWGPSAPGPGSPGGRGCEYYVTIYGIIIDCDVGVCRANLEGHRPARHISL